MFQTPSPTVKGEDIDLDVTMTPLFNDPSTPSVVDPIDLLATPGPDCMTPAPLGSSPAPEAGDNGDKKPTKKRKSWGQVLPEPKTNLPPRFVPFTS